MGFLLVMLYITLVNYALTVFDCSSFNRDEETGEGGVLHMEWEPTIQCSWDDPVWARAAVVGGHRAIVSHRKKDFHNQASRRQRALPVRPNLARWTKGVRTSGIRCFGRIGPWVSTWQCSTLTGRQCGDTRSTRTQQGRRATSPIRCTRQPLHCNTTRTYSRKCHL